MSYCKFVSPLRVFFAGLIAASIGCCRLAVAGDDVSSPQMRGDSATAAERLFELEALRDGRDKVVSGIFRAVEQNVNLASQDDGLVRAEVYCAFDRAAGAYRFERTQKYVVDSTEEVGRAQQPEATANSKPVRTPLLESVTSKAVITSDKAILWSSLSPHEVRIV